MFYLFPFSSCTFIALQNVLRNSFTNINGFYDISQCSGSSAWNIFTDIQKTSTLSLSTFRCQLKHFYFSHYQNTECIQGYFLQLISYISYLLTYWVCWLLQLVDEFLSEQQLPVAPSTFAMGALLNELSGVRAASHSHGKLKPVLRTCWLCISK